MTDLAHPNLDRLADRLLKITREQGKAALLAHLRAMDPDDLETAERALGTRFALGWRANPAAMAEHLTQGEYQRWPYIELLASSWADAFQGVDPHQMWVLPSQYGKGLALDTPIPTPNGWVPMGDLKVGDEVFGGDGKPCRVTYVSPDHLLDCYRIDLWDGASLVADVQHQWRVWDSYGHDPKAWRESRARGRWTTVDTLHFVEDKQKRYRIQRLDGLTLPDADLPIDPYMLGYWLGDGHAKAATLTVGEQDREALLSEIDRAGYFARRQRKDPRSGAWAIAVSTRAAAGTSASDSLQARLRILGVLGNKHVPESYLWSGDKQRLALLQGLMDTDGSACIQGSGYSYMEFMSTRRCLAEAVRTLARSLGIRAKMHEGRATLNGRDCGPKYRTTFVTTVPVFRLPRKSARQYDIPAPRRRLSNVGVRSVERVPSVPTRCIQVDSPDSTYVAGDHLTVTHNTSLCGWGITWALDLNPKLRFMYLSYDADKAVEEGGQWRDMIEAHQDQLSFSLRPDRRARGMWRTDQGGGLYSVGIKGGLAGWPADCLVGDDLIKGWQAAHSPTEREIAWRVWSGQGRLRLQAFTDPMFLVGTRTHEDDPQARQLKLAHDSPEAGGWKVIRLPAIAEAPDPTATDPMLRQPDPLGREPGEVIEPRRFSAQEVNARRLTLGTYLFASMEQARPAPQEGGELKRAWWRQETNLPTTVDDAAVSWDPKLKEKETGDYVVGLYMARTGSVVWVLDMIRGQFTQDGTACAIALMSVRHPLARRHVVENTGNGPEVMESLRSAVAGYVVPEETAVALGMTEAEREAVQALRRRGMGNLIPNTPKGSKVVRARAYSGYLEAGSVKVPAGAPWLGHFLDETAAFGPAGGGQFDDVVDAWSQGMSLLARTAASLQRPQGNVGKAAAVRPGPLPRGFSRR